MKKMILSTLLITQITNFAYASSPEEDVLCFAQKQCAERSTFSAEEVAAKLFINIQNNQDFAKEMTIINQQLVQIKEDDLKTTNVLALEDAFNGQIQMHNEVVISTRRNAKLTGAVIGGALGLLGAVKMGLMSQASSSGELGGMALVLNGAVNGTGLIITAGGAAIGFEIGAVAGHIMSGPEIDQATKLLRK